MKEQDFDASSLEEPDAEPGAPSGEEGTAAEAEPQEAPGQAAAEDPAQEADTGGSSLERNEEETLYVKRGTERRRPRYGTFGALGGLLGLIAGLVLAQLGAIPSGQNYSRLDLTIVLVGLGVPAGILLGLLIALLLDKRSS